ATGATQGVVMKDATSSDIRADGAFVEAGRRGGETVKERYGTPFFQTIGRLGAERGAEKGGEARKKELGSEGYAQLGRMGGKAVFNKLGREHMREIGRKGGKARVAQSRAVESTQAAEAEHA
ncbi:MAG TPA: hypothetical protein VM582_01990, partial [Candidatus Thermoplasmatota archaeon]|nr:hypothetical protein [Candidatus Thermoplasmatota archaeon]